MIEIDAIVATLASSPRQPAALATLVAVEGSSYRRPGARLLLLEDGRRVGSISGGCLEEDVLLRARRVLETGRCETAVYDTTDENDLVWGVGLGCRGVVQIFIEPLPANLPRWVSALAANRLRNLPTKLTVVYGENAARFQGTDLEEVLPEAGSVAGRWVETIKALPLLVVFGAGDDAQPLVRLAKTAGWWVVVADSRERYATAARFPEADSVVVAPAEASVAQLKLDDQAHVVVMTHRFTEDVKLVADLLGCPLAYLGILGARKRTDRVLAELRTKGFVFAPDALERLCAPVGLDLGATTPETIALSIVAELQCTLTGRTPIHLRDRVAPIHG